MQILQSIGQALFMAFSMAWEILMMETPEHEMVDEQKT